MDNIAPHNIDAEQGLLASCLLENGGDILSDCLEAKIRADYFYRPTHQIIFQALADLYAAGVPPDEILLANKLKDAGSLDSIGGHAYLYELTNRIQTTVHAKHWREIVREKFFLRQLIRTSQWTVEQAHGAGQGSVPELLNAVECEFLKIQDDNLTSKSEHAAPSVDMACALITKTLAGRGEVSGVPSGFTDLDRLTSGFHPAEMVVIAARPSIGKTAIAMNIAEHAVLPLIRETRPPTPTLVFSLEMTSQQLMYRLVCARARVDMLKLSNGFCDRTIEMAHAAKEIKASPLYINDGSGLSIMEIRANARRLHQRFGIKKIIIDYLQLVHCPNDNGNREQEVAAISRGLKAMAKELNIPVIVLCQLNRESEREKRPPRLSDLRESGSVEQDADVVLLLCKPRDLVAVEEDDAIAVRRECIIAKNRNGPTGAVSLIFNKRLCRYENYTGHFGG